MRSRSWSTNPSWVAQGDMFIGHWGQYLMAMAAAINAGTDLPFQTLAPQAVLTKDFAVDDSIVAPGSDYYRRDALASNALFLTRGSSSPNVKV